MASNSVAQWTAETVPQAGEMVTIIDSRSLPSQRKYKAGWVERSGRLRTTGEWAVMVSFLQGDGSKLLTLWTRQAAEGRLVFGSYAEYMRREFAAIRAEGLAVAA